LHPDENAMTRFMFAKMINGIGRAAMVELEPCCFVDAIVVWVSKYDGLADKRPIELDVNVGVGGAVGWHIAGGGGKVALRVVDVDFGADFSLDAVRCAATMAAWLALGHDEAGIKFEVEKGRWRAALR
jgi:hypothetical protein